jgi:DNA-binding HxlR family transcriptional regulator
MHDFGQYCHFTKAVEHLGDRWSFLIVRELIIHGPRGFNALTDCLPAISRSVLARRLRKLEMLGLIARDPAARARQAPYRLTPAGEQLTPTLLSLNAWAERWVPEDPALALHDPDVITFWLRHRVEGSALPDRQVVLAFHVTGRRESRNWLLLEHGVEPSLCVEDPGLALERYVYVEADGAALYPIARGLRDWASAVADGSVQLYGGPALIEALPCWFRRVEGDHGRPPARGAAQLAAAT